MTRGDRTHSKDEARGAEGGGKKGGCTNFGARDNVKSKTQK